MMRDRRRLADRSPEELQAEREQQLLERHSRGRSRLAQIVRGGAADLHLHSTASDGSDSPPALLQAVMAQELKAYALTDHDGIQGLQAMGLVRDKLEKLGMDLPAFIPGVEISGVYDEGERKQEVHVLAYFPAGGIEELRPFLQEQRKNRDARNRRMCERLQELGMLVTFEELQGEGGEVLGRPHLATIMIRKGYANSHRDAFDRWLGSGKPAYVPRELPAVQDVLSIARGVGAVTVLAHPSLYRGWMDDEDRLRERLTELQHAGLDGIELYQNETKLEHAQVLSRIGAEMGFLPTIGSDYHGRNKTDVPMLRADKDMTELLEPFEEILEEAAAEGE